MNKIATLTIVLGLATAACSVEQSKAPNEVAYRLYTHCGVLYADLNGTRYYADPPLSDGSGNPPRAWSNPYDDGTLTVVDANTVVFSDSAGNRAAFTTHPASGIPTIYPCD